MKTYQLGELTEKIGSGVTPTGGVKVYKREGRPFVRSQNVGWGKLMLDDVVFIDEETHQGFASTELEYEDVLLNITGASIGRSAVTTEKIVGGNVNQHVCIIRPKRQLMDSTYLCSYLNSPWGQAQIDSFQAGGNRQGLNFGQIASFDIPLPPLPEQRAIASALSDTDDLIAALEALIAKKQALKQGAMQELLTGRRRLTGFKGEWEEVRLGDVAEMSSGGTPDTKNPAFYGGGIKWVSIADMTRTGKYLEQTEKTLTELGYQTSAARLFNPPVLLFAMYASIGKVCISNDNISSSQAILGIECGPKLNIQYLYYQIYAKGNSLRNLGQQGTQANLNKGIVQDLIVSLPPLPEQQAIAAILSDMDGEITELETELGKVRALKQGMMQELLTGRVRLMEREEVDSNG